jgi:hypothetical protein
MTKPASATSGNAVESASNMSRAAMLRVWRRKRIVIRSSPQPLWPPRRAAFASHGSGKRGFPAATKTTSRAPTAGTRHYEFVIVKKASCASNKRDRGPRFAPSRTPSSSQAWLAQVPNWASRAKGAGEAGCIDPGVMLAILNALEPLGVGELDTPPSAIGSGKRSALLGRLYDFY